MSFEHKYLVNRTSTEATMRLYGEIGDKVDGDYFAQELSWLSENVDTVHVRINSAGGSIFQGLSIVSSIMSAKSKVITYVDGVAASMAGVIAVAGHQVFMNDFAKLMIHDPYFADDNGNKVNKLNDRDKRAISAIRNILEGILKRRCKADINIDDMMKAETWLGAEDAKNAGMVDEIITTGRDLKNMEPQRMVALLIDEVDKHKIETMKQLTARLNIAEGSNEQAMIQAIDQMENAAKAPVQTMIDSLLKNARLAGKVTDVNEQELRSLAGTDLNAFLAKVELKAEDFQKESPVRLSDVISELQKASPVANKKDWDWYQKNDPMALRALMREKPDEYKKLYKEYWGEEP